MSTNSQYGILSIDPYLMPFKGDIHLRMENYKRMKRKLVGEEETLISFANGSLYYGFHCTEEGWFYREWAPNAEELHLIGDFNNWNRQSHPMNKLENGNWEIFIPGKDTIKHESLVKVQITSHGARFDRIPLYSTRVYQNPKDNSFSGQIWCPPEAFIWTDQDFTTASNQSPLIYECHVGMASEEGKIGSYREFTKQVLPWLKEGGYNTVQLMAIMEHPYYASFGYQVSNFFAASSRFGTPEDLKELINTAHSMGITVLLDLVHSHACGNTMEGINLFDGSDFQFFHSGEQGNHPAWGTKLFNYSKPEVIHYLLSNIKFWMSEYHFDGFRFDGVTSMLYHHHGLGTAFDNYSKYFSMDTDTEAVTYLQLANELIHELNPHAISIAEDMSGMPGMCIPIAEGGIGFDYRLGMGVPDFWIKTLSKQRDEDWDLGKMWHELTTRRPQEKTIGYAESHDQALVGDKTIMFWLADQEMYWHMSKDSQSLIIDRAIALHKMIRLITISLAGDGYLNFMGNEFGHPEWIDFPREGNGWSYHYARRQWSLAKKEDLKYQYLLQFDHSMLNLVNNYDLLHQQTEYISLDNSRKCLAYRKNNLLFLFNFNPVSEQSVEVPLFSSKIDKLILNSSSTAFGGWMTNNEENLMSPSGDNSIFRIPSRTALVYQLN